MPPPPDQSSYDPGYGEQPEYTSAQPPPPLPEYDQPPVPGDDYIWTPGYWAWSPDGYYWVPGAWVEAPYEGALWTPGYWGFWNNRYGFYRGYWGQYIGYYGGIDYGFGYVGFGYQGGYWGGGHLRLQPLGQQREHLSGAQRLQPFGGRLHERLPREL